MVIAVVVSGSGNGSGCGDGCSCGSDAIFSVGYKSSCGSCVDIVVHGVL